MKPLFTGVLLLAAGCSVGESLPSSGGDVLDKVSYVVVPHPDDEMQAWSLIEDTPDAYKVFVILTYGEQTRYCASPGYDEGTGEASPFPWPAGRWMSSCESARRNSFFDFMAEMARSDDGLPSSFAFEGVKGPFDSLGYTICRNDAGGCVSDRTAKVGSVPPSGGV